MNMKTQLATIRITGAVEKSTAVMASMSRLIKIPELQKTMTSMSKEMTKMGIIDEMMDDAMSSLDPEDIEEAADTEVPFDGRSTESNLTLNFRLKRYYTN